MARVLFGAAITAINGSVGGTTFQRNRYGTTMKNKSIIADPNSPDVNELKLVLQTVSTQWRNLTQPQRDTWNNWAVTNPTPTRLDPTKYLNGFNLFVKYHMIKYLGGIGSPLTAPDFTLQTLNTISGSCQNIGAALRFTINFVASSPDWIAFLFVSGPVSQSQYLTGNPTRYMSNQPAAASPVFINTGSNYTDKFGVLAPIGSFVIAELTFIRSNSPQIVESGPIRMPVT